MWVRTAWQHISPEVAVEGFKKCCVATGLDGNDNECCGMAVKRMGMLGVSVRKMKALSAKLETVILVGKGR